MISVRNLSFSYGSHRVLEDISFDASPGEMLCILGANGAGKSTLFKCILGLLKGYKGSVTVDGRPLEGMSAKEKALIIAYIPQATRPAFAYNVMDMVLMGTTARMQGMMSPGTDERALATEALRRVGIEHLAERDYTKISGGEQQLVLIARALAQGAKILIMDEPTSSLDYGNQVRTQQQLRGLVEEGYTIIQSTHNPEQTFSYADRVLCIKDGRVYAEGRPEDVMDEKLIKDIYGIDTKAIDVGNDRFYTAVR